MSEAAKPADPERALARIASLERHAADALHDGMLRDVTAGDLQMLLPLARAGLRAASADLLRAAFLAGANFGDYQARWMGETPTADVGFEHWNRERAAAVLRSPEPATPADGGA